MAGQVTQLQTAAALRGWVAAQRASGARVALVPTMGALHAGHQALVRAAVSDGCVPVVSIFVNPTQFGPNEDFARYPRMVEADSALVAEAGGAAVFTPEAEEMYGGGFATRVEVPELAQHLCGAFRPGHFAGVATIVTKLLNSAGADVAYFGEKDWQQLQIIRRLVADLNIPTKIRGVPIVREADGLALSSRNRYLDAAQRALALRLSAELREAARSLRAQPQETAAILQGARERLTAAGFNVDYFSLADGASCAPLTQPVAGAQPRLFVAARLGGTRLIDNWAVDE